MKKCRGLKNYSQEKEIYNNIVYGKAGDKQTPPEFVSENQFY